MFDFKRLSTNPTLVAIYIFLVVITPVVPMRPLPPLRIDDPFLILLFLIQISTRTLRFDLLKHPVPIACISLAICVFLTTAIGTSLYGLPATFGDYFDAGIFIRFALVYAVVGSTRISPAFARLFAISFLLASLVNVGVGICQQNAFEPINSISSNLYTGSQRYTDVLLFRHSMWRVFGTIGNPNYYAFSVAVAASFGLALAFFQGSKGKVTNLAFSFLIIPISLYAILVQSGSRAGIILLFLATTLTVIHSFIVYRRVTFANAFLFFVVIFLLALTTYAFREQLPTRVAEFLNASGKEILYGDQFLGTRLYFWKDRWSEMLQSPTSFFTGFGFSGSALRVMDNGYYYVFYRGGIVTLFIYLFLWFNLFSGPFRLASNQRIFVNLRIFFTACACTILISGISEFLFETFLQPKMGVLIVAISSFSATIQTRDLPLGSIRRNPRFSHQRETRSSLAE